MTPPDGAGQPSLGQPNTGQDLLNTGKGLGRPTAYMAIGTLASRLTGLIRLLVAADALGSNSLSDAFNLANNTPNIVHDLVLGGVLSATFIPQFVSRLASKSRDEAIDSISAVISASAVLLFAATVAFLFLAPYVIDLYSYGQSGPAVLAERAVATDLLRLFAFQLFAYGAISLMSSVLNVIRRFVLVMFVPIINNAVAIAVLLEFRSVVHHQPSLASVQHDHAMLLWLGLGTTAGVVAQAAALVPAMVRSELRLRLVWRPRDPAIREILSLSGWTLGFVIANQVAVFVVLAIALHLGTGRVTDYSYAFQFFQLPYGIVAVSVMSAVVPELALRYKIGDLTEMSHQFGLGLRRMMAGILPSTVGYLLLAGPLVALLLEHGSFNPAGARRTAVSLAFLAVGLPGFCIYLLCIATFQAMRDTRTAFFLYLLENGLNIILAFILAHIGGIGGLSLSFSLAYSLSAIVAMWVVRSRMGGLGGPAVAHYVGRSLLLSGVMAVVVAVATVSLGSPTGSGLYVRVVGGVVAGAVAYGLAAGLAGTFAGWQTARRRQAVAGRESNGRDPGGD
ncbi:MAG: murein biosynthesis integral membrane protein MurJ [Acidimicrobiales bacterium]